MKQIELKIAWSFRISTEFETFRNIFETCTMTRTVTPWPACRCILSHLFQGAENTPGMENRAKESKQVILIHFGHRMTSDKPRWPTQRWRYLQHQILFLARTESKKTPGEDYATSMPPSHNHTITGAEHWAFQQLGSQHRAQQYLHNHGKWQD